MQALADKKINITKLKRNQALVPALLGASGGCITAGCSAPALLASRGMERTSVDSFCCVYCKQAPGL
jgi:hypothetical protein